MFRAVRVFLLQALAALAIATVGAGLAALLTRAETGQWGLGAFWVLVVAGLLFIAAPLGNSGLVWLQGHNPWWPQRAMPSAAAESANLPQTQCEYMDRRQRGGFSLVFGMAAVFVLAFWLFVG